MQAFEKMRAFFHDQAERLPEPSVPTAISIEVPASDMEEEEDLAVLSAGEHSLAEGQFLIIEYCDGAGRKSVRRVSVYAIKANAKGIPSLVAKCHERRAQRSFRVDRILSVFDHDGVAIEPLTDFYRDTFGLKWPVPGLIYEEPNISAGRKAVIRSICRNRGIILLAALAMADHELCEEEIGEILDACASWCAEEGLELSPDEIAYLSGYVRRLRPSPEAISDSVEKLIGEPAPRVRSVISAGLRVINADGFLHHREVGLLNDISQELAGVTIV